MSTPIVMNTAVPTGAVRPLDTFRRQVATYYANILHGQYLRNEPMVYVFPYILAGFTFDAPQLQPRLNTLLTTKLTLKDGQELQFIYKRILRETNNAHRNGEVELYLRIEAIVSVR